MPLLNETNNNWYVSDNFDIKLLEIEEEKLKIKREHNAIDTNEISLWTGIPHSKH